MKDLVNQTQDIVNLSVKLAEPSKENDIIQKGQGGTHVGKIRQTKEQVVHAIAAHRAEKAAKKLPVLASPLNGSSKGARGTDAPCMAKTAEGRDAEQPGDRDTGHGDDEAQQAQHLEGLSAGTEKEARASLGASPSSHQPASPALGTEAQQAQQGAGSRLQRWRETAVQAAQNVSHRVEEAAKKLPLLGHQLSIAPQSSTAITQSALPMTPSSGSADDPKSNPEHIMVRTLGEVRPSPPNSRIVASSEPKDLQGGDCEGVDGGRNGEGSGTFFPETLGDAIKVAKGEDDEDRPRNVGLEDSRRVEHRSKL